MPYTTPEQPEIKENILRDILNLNVAAAVGDDSDHAVRASATSAAIEGLYQHQQWIVRQIFPDVADIDLMEVHAALRKINYKAETNSVGSIEFTGTPAAAIPINTEGKTTDGIAFVTTEAGVISGGGSVTVAAQASVAGVAGNVDANTAVTLTGAPGGIDSGAVIISMLAGTDVETPGSLLDRLLFLLRNPPASGNKADYTRWAKEVDGVDEAFVYPLRRGLGTTDVVITSGGGLPSAQLIADVEDHINEERPCGVNTLTVLAPAIISQNFTIQVKVSGITLASAEGLINGVLDSYYETLLPGDVFVRSVAEALVSDIVGITDRAITAPAANVVPTVDAGAVEWCRKGTVAVTAMS